MIAESNARDRGRHTGSAPLRVRRVAHHGVVAAWRERERELIRQGAEVRLLSARRWNEGGAPVRFRKGADGFATAARTLGTHPNAFAYAPPAVWRLVGEEMDVLDLHEEPCSLATAQFLLARRLRGRRMPFVLYSAQNIPKRYPAPFRWFERYALAHAAGAYVCNEEAGRILRRKGLVGEVRVIGLGFSPEDFFPGEAAGPHERLRIAYVGRLEAHKGVGVLLAAVAELPDTEVTITGDGSLRDGLRAEAARRGIDGRVRFEGFVAGGLADVYRRADVVVIPSLPTSGWLEQFGRVAVEAMACGVPVVASRSGALPDVVADAGILVEPGDPAALRDALVMVREPRRWGEMREAGLRRAAGYTWDKIASQQIEFYHDALGVRRAAPEAASDPHVVVVAYGRPEPLRAALAGLSSEFSVTIVDNSSRSDTRDLAKETGAHYIDPGANLGFAAGVNAALESLDARRIRADVLLLNPDATITAGGVRALAAGLAADAGLACVGPVQVHPGGGEERVSWPFPSPFTAWAGALGVSRFDRRHGFVIGSILLLRRAALDDVGLFDDDFFLYAEETDWQYRARQRGWRTAVVPGARGTHVGAGTGGDQDARLAAFHSSGHRYMAKHYGRWGAAAYRWANVVGAGIRSVLPSGEGRDGARRRLRLFVKGEMR